MVIISIPMAIFLVVIAIICWKKYVDGEGIFLSLFFSFLSIIWIILSIKILYPYFKDFFNVRNRKWIITYGRVCGFKEVHSSGDPPTTDYYPILELLDSKNTITIDVDGMEQGKKYKFIYLPYTKLAIIVNEEK